MPGAALEGFFPAAQPNHPFPQCNQLVMHRGWKALSPPSSVAEELVERRQAFFRVVPHFSQRVGDPRESRAELFRAHASRKGQQPVDRPAAEGTVGRQRVPPNPFPLRRRCDRRHVELRHRFAVENSAGLFQVGEFELESLVL